MKDEELLAAVGDRVRSDRAQDTRWEAVARGEATEAELAELERRAKDDPEIAAMLEACRPLGDAAEARIAERLGEPKVVPITAAKKKAGAAARVAILAGPIALAAAVLLHVTVGQRAGGPDLPGYGVSATSEQAMRGPAAAASSLRIGGGADARFTILARPERAAAERVVAYAFAVPDAPGADPSPLDAKIEVAPEGSVRITGAAHALRGAREVRLVVGAPASVGRFDDALSRAREGRSDARVRVLVVAIERASDLGGRLP